MRTFQRCKSLAFLAVVIAIAAGVGVASRWQVDTRMSKANDDNPNRFYLCATEKGFSIRYAYDPHAADLWMFQTAEGHLVVSNRERGH